METNDAILVLAIKDQEEMYREVRFSLQVDWICDRRAYEEFKQLCDCILTFLC